MPSGIRNLWGLITGADAKKTFPQQQGESLGRLGNYYCAQPYGFYANLPNGQLFHILSEDGNIVFGVTVERPSGVEQGEVTIHHPAAGSKIHLKNNGDIEVEATGDVNINSVNANITSTGSVSIASTGSASLTSSASIAIVAPTIEITGALTNNGENIGDGHGHNQGVDSAGDTQATISGVT